MLARSSLLPLFFSYLLLTIFFFYCYVDHRDLHSFPTRRSSDLSGCQAARTPRVPCRRRPSPASSRARWRRAPTARHTRRDRKSTRLNSSHANISYAVFCLKKKKKTKNNEIKEETDTQARYCPRH